MPLRRMLTCIPIWNHRLVQPLRKLVFGGKDYGQLLVTPRMSLEVCRGICSLISPMTCSRPCRTFRMVLLALKRGLRSFMSRWRMTSISRLPSRTLTICLMSQSRLRRCISKPCLRTSRDSLRRRRLFILSMTSSLTI